MVLQYHMQLLTIIKCQRNKPTQLLPRLG